MDTMLAYIPEDRRRALAGGRDLPDRSMGAVLFADISGFTSLAEALSQTWGERRGADELTRHLNTVYGTIIAQVQRWGGSVVGFSGDAITCWFEAENGVLAEATWRAVAGAFALQDAMARVASVSVSPDLSLTLAIKVAVAAGPVRRFLVGDPQIQRLDVLAGTTLDRMAAADQLANQWEVVLDPEAWRQIHRRAEIQTWRAARQQAGFGPAQTGLRFAVVARLDPGPPPPAEDPAPIALSAQQVQPWLLPDVYRRLAGEEGRFLAELRPAVALFVQFTGLDYDRDEAAGAKLDSYIRWVQAVLADCGGSLIQLTTGDKGSYLYAAFGAPIAYDDNEERAATAALALRSLPDRLAFIAQVRMGISRGRMRVGAYGSETRRTYGVLGDATNLAARLMTRAEPGQILVDPRVAAAVSHTHRLHLLGTVQLKGRHTALPVHAVIGPQQRRSGWAVHPSANPLLGREGEKERIGHILQATTTGKGHVLHIEGNAGVGKSHLAAHLAQEAETLGLCVAAGVCLSTGRGVAYFPFRQLIPTLLDVADVETDEPIGAVSARLEAALTALNPDWLLRLPLLGDLLGLPIPDNPTTVAFDPRLRQEALVALVVEIALTRARTRPLLLLLEDVHWFDEASTHLTLALARIVATAPILLVLTQRPLEAQETRPLDEMDQFPSRTRMALQELPLQGVEALITQRLRGPLSPLALSLIQAQAQGNPFFVEELLHALVESGSLVQQEGVWTLSQPLLQALLDANCLARENGTWRLVDHASLPATSLGIPDSIHGIVLSRLDRLSEPNKLTLKVASVIGRIFELRLLDQSHPGHPGTAQLEAQLARLAERDFAHLTAAIPLPVYMFKHNITQEVVYRTLLADQQADLHLAVAQALEEWQPGAVERLAFHFRHAELSQEPVRAKALHYLDAAGHRAEREYANETALAYYSRALALETRWRWLAARVRLLHILGRRGEEQAALHDLAASPDAPPFDVALLWGDYHEAVSDYGAAQAALHTALSACRDAGDRRGETRILSRLGLIAWRQGNYDEAETTYGRALALLAGTPDCSDVEAEARYGLGIVYRQLGRYEAAEEQLQHALHLNRLLDNRQEEAKALAALGTVAHLQRHFAQALDAYRQALAIRRTIGDRPGEGASLVSVAQAVMDMGDYGEAKQILYEALAIQQAVANRWWEAIVWNDLGIVFMMVGQLDTARQSLDRGLAIKQDIGDTAGQAYVLCNLGQVVRDQGDLDTAHHILTEGLAIARSQGDRYLEAMYCSELATVHLRGGQTAQAVELASASLSILRSMELEELTTADLATLASACMAAGNQEQAQDWARQALAVLDGGGGQGADFPHRDYFACYQILSASRRPEAAQALQAAHRLLMERAGRISDPDMRQSYLENILHNRSIVDAARLSGMEAPA